MLEGDMIIHRWPSQALLDNAPADWQILMLYSLGSQATRLYEHRHSKATLWERWTLDKRLRSAGAYLINRSGMKQVHTHPLLHLSLGQWEGRRRREAHQKRDNRFVCDWDDSGAN